MVDSVNLNSVTPSPSSKKQVQGGTVKNSGGSIFLDKEYTVEHWYKNSTQHAYYFDKNKDGQYTEDELYMVDRYDPESKTWTRFSDNDMDGYSDTKHILAQDGTVINTHIYENIDKVKKEEETSREQERKDIENGKSPLCGSRSEVYDRTMENIRDAKDTRPFQE